MVAEVKSSAVTDALTLCRPLSSVVFRDLGCLRRAPSPRRAPRHHERLRSGVTRRGCNHGVQQTCGPSHQ